MAYDEDLANRLRELVGSERGLSERRMFGGLAFLINGNMAISASCSWAICLRICRQMAHEHRCRRERQ
jgi:TfoX/Sxy family transcriptional regulator of competence genes